MILSLTVLSNIKLYQPQTGYRFSMEPFVLARSVEDSLKHHSHNLKVADFGSGCGIIALLIAKKFTKARIYAIEKNREMRAIIAKNIRLNSLNNIEIVETSSDIQTNGIDILVSNPPYFTDRHYRTSKKHRTEKFETHINIDELISEARRILNNKGLFFISYHSTRIAELIEKLKNNNFGIKSITPAYGAENRPAQFIVLEAQLSGKDFVLIKPSVNLRELSKNLRYGSR